MSCVDGWTPECILLPGRWTWTTCPAVRSGDVRSAVCAGPAASTTCPARGCQVDSRLPPSPGPAASAPLAHAQRATQAARSQDCSAPAGPVARSLRKWKWSHDGGDGLRGSAHPGRRSCGAGCRPQPGGGAGRRPVRRGDRAGCWAGCHSTAARRRCEHLAMAAQNRTRSHAHATVGQPGDLICPQIHEPCAAADQHPSLHLRLRGVATIS